MEIELQMLASNGVNMTALPQQERCVVYTKAGPPMTGHIGAAWQTLRK